MKNITEITFIFRRKNGPGAGVRLSKKSSLRACSLLMPLVILLSALLFCGCGSKEQTSAPEGTDTSNSGEDASAYDSDEILPEKEPDLHPYSISLLFAGDINFDEHTPSGQKLAARNWDISQCIDPELIRHMQEADLMLLNNEFTYSNRGEPLPGKLYTFRAKPESVSILQELGVDVVQLANNHVYDYGKEAILDTFETLEDAGIPYVGAGRNLKEAVTPHYATIQGKTIAIVAASRAEKNPMTPQATESEPGILRCYDTELFVQKIKEARQNADFVIAIVHWGTEHSTVLEDVQVETAKEYIDAGADVIIGGHTHCLQGIEYYNGKPVVYSIGNFWFWDYSFDTVLLNLTLIGDDNSCELQVSLIPAYQTDDSVTHACSSFEEERRIYDYMESISDGKVSIDDEGVVHPTE